MKRKAKAATAASKAPARIRRTQAERTATMRSRIIHAAIASLAEIGYSATSTNIVARRAGVSRGAMTHHFASKVDLMIAIIETVFHEDLAYYSRELAKFTTDRERTLGLIDLAWKAFSSPGGLAVLHIMMAGPGDDELKKRLPFEMTRINEQADNLRRPNSVLGQSDRSLVASAVLMHRATLRGLAIEMLSGTSTAKIDSAIELLKTYCAYMLDVLAPQHGPKDAPEKA